jgi:hypothetical protein
MQTLTSKELISISKVAWALNLKLWLKLCLLAPLLLLTNFFVSGFRLCNLDELENPSPTGKSKKRSKRSKRSVKKEKLFADSGKFLFLLNVFSLDYLDHY